MSSWVKFQLLYSQLVHAYYPAVVASVLMLAVFDVSMVPICLTINQTLLISYKLYRQF